MLIFLKYCICVYFLIYEVKSTINDFLNVNIDLLKQEGSYKDFEFIMPVKKELLENIMSSVNPYVFVLKKDLKKAIEVVAIYEGEIKEIDKNKNIVVLSFLKNGVKFEITYTQVKNIKVLPDQKVKKNEVIGYVTESFTVDVEKDGVSILSIF